MGKVHRVLAGVLICALLVASLQAGQGQAVAAGPVAAGPDEPSIPMRWLQRQRRRLLKLLILKSQLILAGRVTDMQSQRVQKVWGEVIESDLTIRPEQVLKGSTAGDIHFPHFLGGIVGETFMRVGGEPFFWPGERVLLFLKARSGAQAAASGQWEVIDGSFGKLTINEQGFVDKLGMPWRDVRTEILSYLSGARVYLPILPKGFSLGDGRSLTYPSTWTPDLPQASLLYDTFEVKWPGHYPSIPYYIYNPGFNDPQAGTVAQQNGVIQQSAQVWGRQGQARTNFTLRYAGLVDQHGVKEDGINVVSVWDVDVGGTLAATFNWGTSAGWYEADIIFYDTVHKYALEPNGDPALTDLMSVAVHEFGHFASLDHPAVQGTTMWPYYTGGTEFNRTLHLDDIMGMKYLYGLYYELHDQSETQSAERNDRFGHCMAAGDFDGDGKEDLAVGVPYEDLSTRDEGHVAVFLGTVGGLDAWHDISQSSDPSERGDQFGYSLAAGDFDGDGRDDLAVGTPFEDLGGNTDVGVVYVFPGSPQPTVFGLPYRLEQPMAGGRNEAGDRFGWVLAAGDFDGDGFDDLAVGAPYEDFRSTDDGVVFVFEGSGSGLGRGYYVHQEQAGGRNENFDRFGWSLAVGSFNGDSYDDLAIGAPLEDVSGAVDAGLVFIFEGSSGHVRNGYYLDQRPAGADEAYDMFGEALAAGDMDGDGYDDLAVGAPGEDRVAVNEGVVFLFHGDMSGLGSPRAIGQFPAGTPEQGDEFGSVLVMGDFNDDGCMELAIGCPDEDLGGSSEGYVFVYQGYDDSGRDDETMMGLRQSPMAIDQPGDRFGSALVVGDFSQNGIDDLAIAAPYKDGAATDTGLLFIWRYRP